MKAIFDACSIIILFNERREKVLNGAIIPYLAFYEIGNAIWKEIFIFKRGTVEEGIKYWTRIYEYCKEKCKIVGKINVIDTLNIAVKHGVTFYDAVYVYIAKRYGVPLITADKKLIEKAKHVIKVWNIKDFL